MSTAPAMPEGTAATGQRSQMVVTQQPALDPATGTFSLTVAIEDDQGQLVTNTDANSALPPELRIATGPDNAVVYDATSSDGNGVMGTLNPDGTVTFSGLKVSDAGTYTFEVDDATPVATVLTGPVTLPASGPPPTTIGTVFTTPTLTAATGTTPTTTTTDVSGNVTTSPTVAAQLTKAAKKAAKAEKVAAAKLARAQRIAASKAARLERIAERKAAKAARLAALQSQTA